MAGPSTAPKVVGPRSCWAPSMWRICIADRCSPVRGVGPSRRGSSSRFGPESTLRPACAASRPRTARDSSCISAPSRSVRSSCARRESRSIDKMAMPWRSSGSTGRSPRESPTGSPCAMHRRAGPSGGLVLWPDPPRGVSRRRATPARLDALVDTTLRLDALGEPEPSTAWLELAGVTLDHAGSAFAPDVRAALELVAIRAVEQHHAAHPGLERSQPRRDRCRPPARRPSPGHAPPGRGGCGRRPPARPARRRGATGPRRRPPSGSAARHRTVARAARSDGPARGGAGVADTAAAWPTRRAPPAARRMGSGRSRRKGGSCGWMTTWRGRPRRTGRWLGPRSRWPRAAPLTPAAYRDAIGSSRKYVMAILEDLDRRELLRRTDAGHVLGRRSLAKARPAAPVETP